MRKIALYWSPAFLMGLVSLVLIAVGLGLAVSNNRSRQPAQSAANHADSWKTYCSDYGYLCFDYPSGWQLHSEATSQEAISPETTTVVSPSGDVILTYRPNYGVTGQFEGSKVSVVDVAATRADDLWAIAQIDELDNGGISERPFTPQLFVTNQLTAGNGTKLATGTTYDYDDEPVVHLFTPRNNKKLASMVTVKFGQTNDWKTDAGHFASIDDARAVLDSSEARIAYRILQTIRYR